MIDYLFYPPNDSFPPRTQAILPRANEDDWKTVLRDAVRAPDELLGMLDLAPEDLDVRQDTAAKDFPLLVPRPFVDRMRRGDPHDPLLRQILPTASELDPAPGFTTDPLGESDTASPHGVLSKYHGRSLILTTPHCCVHCRYCFRRHFPFQPGPCDAKNLTNAILSGGIILHCREVILSGGDPLSLETTCLSEISEATFHLPHIRHLRVHARFPVMIPQRVDDELLAWIAATTGRGLPMTIVLQVNHAAEIDGAVAAACQRMIQAGAMLLCQSVLLRGVNDDEDALSDLLLRLVDIRVLPYYLHQLDRTAGAAHFEVPIQRGRALIAALRERLPGYAIPRYVRELPGGTSKEVLQ